MLLLFNARSTAGAPPHLRLQQLHLAPGLQQLVFQADMILLQRCIICGHCIGLGLTSIHLQQQRRQQEGIAGAAAEVETVAATAGETLWGIRATCGQLTRRWAVADTDMAPTG